MCDTGGNSYAIEKFNELDEFINSLDSKKGALISVLHKAQSIFGYLPTEVQSFIGEKLNIPAAKVNGVVSFYSYFTEKPKGKHVIQICLGTACFVRGASDLLKELEEILKIKAGQTTADGKFSIDGLRCVGACGLSPVLIVDGKVFGRVKPDQVEDIIEQYR